MPNKASANEWLTLAEHDLTAATILFKEKHFTDTVGMLLQQAIEKIFKSVLAYNNQHIKKSHDLAELYALIDTILLDETELDILDLATGFFQENRYPNAYYSLPTENEIKIVLALANSLSAIIASLLV